MVFQVDSEPIADMNWFWLEQKGLPREAFFVSKNSHFESSAKSILKTICDVLTNGE